MKIIGLRIEKYLGEVISDNRHKFNTPQEELERHILLGYLDDKRKVEITLSAINDECISGYCTASYGYIKVKEVDRYNGYQYRAIKELVIPDILPETKTKDYSNEVFTLSYNGGDKYYPSGGYTVNMYLFEKTIRAKEKRPVWLFYGNSNLGKSFLSDKMIYLTKYETDSNKELPTTITESIIVVGNKYKFTIDDIKNRIFGEYELILVNFTLG